MLNYAARFPANLRLALALTLAAAAPLVFAQEQTHMQHTQHMQMPEPAAGTDGRIAVAFPAMLKEHTLANMRDHLRTLSLIQGYLAERKFDQAGKIAEDRLGMSSLPLHGAHEVAPYMPKGMQDAGTAMHKAASQFAVATEEAAVDDDVPKALKALNKVTETCVACHAAYRLK